MEKAVTRIVPQAIVYEHLEYLDYLQVINQCDLFINPFPFGNTNGIVDTVRQVLPGVCLSGAEVHEHIDEGLFRRLGLAETLITHSLADYITVAVRLITCCLPVSRSSLGGSSVACWMSCGGNKQ